MAAAAAEISVDKRASNHMSGEMKLVHLRLEAWGKWARDRIAPWPERTVRGRLIDEGPGAGHAAPGVAEIPEPIAETDRAVAHLGDIDRRIVRTYYVEWAPLEQLARRAKMSPRQFQNVLNRARWRILGYLSAQRL